MSELNRAESDVRIAIGWRTTAP